MMTAQIINNVVENLDKFILLEKFECIPLNRNFYNNKYTIEKNTRIFFVSKLVLNCILPNQGNVFGYNLSDNFFKFVYNYCFRTEKELPFILKHNFGILKNYYNSYKSLKENLNKFVTYFNFNNYNLKNEDINLNVEIAASQIIDDSFNSISTQQFSYRTWDQFFKDNINLDSAESIFKNYDDYILYKNLKNVKNQIIEIKDFEFTFHYKYIYHNLLSFVKIISNSNFLEINSGKFKFNKYIPMNNLKDYFFKDVPIDNIVVNELNKLEKNENNYYLILNFVKILYTNPSTSYLHLYINIYSIQTISNPNNKVFLILEPLEDIIYYRLDYCKRMLENQNESFLNLFRNDDYLKEDQLDKKEKIIDFLEEYDNCSINNNIDSRLMKEYFLLKTIKNILNNFHGVSNKDLNED